MLYRIISRKNLGEDTVIEHEFENHDGEAIQYFRNCFVRNLDYAFYYLLQLHRFTNKPNNKFVVLAERRYIISETRTLQTPAKPHWSEGMSPYEEGKVRDDMSH